GRGPRSRRPAGLVRILALRALRRARGERRRWQGSSRHPRRDPRSRGSSSMSCRSISDDMTSYQTISNSPTSAVTILEELLRAHGSTHCDAANSPDVWLVGTDNVTHAAAVLDSLSGDQRSKALLIGVLGTLDVRHKATPGTLADLLERYQPL